MHHAASNGSKRIVTLLLEKGAQINAQDRVCLHMIISFVLFDQFVQRWNTPLRLANQSGYREVVSLLLEKGGQIDAPDRVGLPLTGSCNYLNVTIQRTPSNGSEGVTQMHSDDHLVHVSMLCNLFCT